MSHSAAVFILLLYGSLLVLIVSRLLYIRFSRRKLDSAVAKREARCWPQLKRAAKQLGLRFEGAVIDGEIDGCLVDIRNRVGDEGYKAIVSVKPAQGSISALLVLGREPSSALKKRLIGPDLATGAAAFDRLVRVEGDEDKVIALLDHATRRLVAREIERGVRVEDGAVTLEWADLGWTHDPRSLVERVRGMVELARALVVHWAELEERLAKNAVDDPAPDVQLRNLDLLYAHFGRTDTVLKTNRRLLSASDPRVRLQAALRLGSEGFETLQDLVEADEIPTAGAPRPAGRLSYGRPAPVGIRCEALQHLLGFDGPRVRPILDAALASTQADLRRAAVAGVGDLRHRPALPNLVAMLEEADEPTKIEIATALGKLEDPAAEPPLLRLLDTESSDLGLVVARALGSVGTIAAVEPLLSCIETWNDAEAKSLARAAVASIQARLGEVEAGRLTLAAPSPQDGALSLTGEAGRLSSPEKDAGAPPGDPAAQAAPDSRQRESEGAA